MEVEEMTENEAVELIKKIYIDTYQSERCLSLKMAISALFDIQEYRSIGAVDECREAMEKQRVKKWKEVIYMDNIVCPCCKAEWNVIDNCTENFDYCPRCGQRLE